MAALSQVSVVTINGHPTAVASLWVKQCYTNLTSAEVTTLVNALNAAASAANPSSTVPTSVAPGPTFLG